MLKNALYKPVPRMVDTGSCFNLSPPSITYFLNCPLLLSYLQAEKRQLSNFILKLEAEVVWCLRPGTRMGRLTSCVSLCSTAVAAATPRRGALHSTEPPWRPLHYLAMWSDHLLTPVRFPTSPRTRMMTGWKMNDWEAARESVWWLGGVPVDQRCRPIALGAIKDSN